MAQNTDDWRSQLVHGSVSFSSYSSFLKDKKNSAHNYSNKRKFSNNRHSFLFFRIETQGNYDYIYLFFIWAEVGGGMVQVYCRFTILLHKYGNLFADVSVVC